MLRYITNIVHSHHFSPIHQRNISWEEFITNPQYSPIVNIIFCGSSCRFLLILQASPFLYHSASRLSISWLIMKQLQRFIVQWSKTTCRQTEGPQDLLGKVYPGRLHPGRAGNLGCIINHRRKFWTIVMMNWCKPWGWEWANHCLFFARQCRVWGLAWFGSCQCSQTVFICEGNIVRWMKAYSLFVPSTNILVLKSDCFI